MTDHGVTLERLEDQIVWYDRKSRACKNRYMAAKLVQLTASAAIPAAVLLGPDYAKAIPVVLGTLLVAGEGLLQLARYHENWLSYRATSEALKHEKFLFLAVAGPYTATANALQLLAVRIEAIVSQENSSWVTTQAVQPEAQKSGV
jgi:hypothetical protein